MISKKEKDITHYNVEFIFICKLTGIKVIIF